MWYAIAVLLVVLWLAGWLVFEVVGAAIHLLVILAVVALAVGLFRKAKRTL